MAATADAPDDSPTVDDSSVFYDTWLDYLVVGLLALQALVLAGFGVSFVGDVDRSFAEKFAAEFFAEPEAAEFPLTEPELADVVYTVLAAVGWGLVVTGVLTVAVAVLFYRYRQRVRDLVADGRPAPRWHAPLFGGILATALVFVPLVQVLGGAAAGSLSDRSATADGALSGVVFAAPAYVLWVAVAVGAFASGIGSIAVLVVFGMLLNLVVDVVLGAIGGLAAGLLS